MVRLTLSQIILTIALVLAISKAAQAQTFEMGEARFQGNGCPSGTATAVVSPDRNEISILFDRFSVELSANRNVNIATCQLIVPLYNITPGYAIEAVSFDYRGFANLPKGAALLTSDGFISARGNAGVRKEKIVGTGDFFISQRVLQSRPGRKCAKSNTEQINLQVSLALNSGKQGRQTEGLVTLDTADVGSDGGLKIGVELRPCKL